MLSALISIFVVAFPRIIKQIILIRSNNKLNFFKLSTSNYKQNLNTSKKILISSSNLFSLNFSGGLASWGKKTKESNSLSKNLKYLVMHKWLKRKLVICHRLLVIQKGKKINGVILKEETLLSQSKCLKKCRLLLVKIFLSKAILTTHYGLYSPCKTTSWGCGLS